MNKEINTSAREPKQHPQETRARSTNTQDTNTTTTNTHHNATTTEPTETRQERFPWIDKTMCGRLGGGTNQYSTCVSGTSLEKIGARSFKYEQPMYRELMYVDAMRVDVSAEEAEEKVPPTTLENQTQRI